jgi:phosphoribosylaminoimidazolecarboxamide formyltransferase / IMP cyclohydrolase
MMSELVQIRTALLSVSDKTDLVAFASALAARGVKILSTGGTAKTLTDAGIRVTPIEQVTGFPEIMDGRVKTLHPLVHGALLGKRDNPEHTAAMKKHGIEPIDLVCINLYPFERTVSQPGVTMVEAIEQIDVGGPAMVRAAAKNARWVTVVTSPKRYDLVISEMDAHDGATTPELRAELAAAAFGMTSEYDAAIASFLSRRSPQAFPQVLRTSYTKVDDLRYGENPHQEAALYRDPASTGPTVVNARQLHGKELSYNNINDAAAALEVVKALRRLASTDALKGVASTPLVGACVVKHTNPCGAALAASPAKAIDAAIAGDTVAAYGGILAVNAVVDVESAQRICREGVFLEVIVAPEFEPAALEMIAKRWANVRVLAVGERAASTTRKLEYRSVPGGMLVQDRDTASSQPAQWEHKAGPAATPTQLAAGAFLETICRFVTSNAVIVGGHEKADTPVIRVFGVGSGQVDRVSACRLAVGKAGALANGAVAAGDAFFPFDDGPKVLAEAGVAMMVHPGGSKRDEDTFKLCQDRGITCVTTGVRHFRH